LIIEFVDIPPLLPLQWWHLFATLHILSLGVCRYMDYLKALHWLVKDIYVFLDPF